MRKEKGKELNREVKIEETRKKEKGSKGGEKGKEKGREEKKGTLWICFPRKKNSVATPMQKCMQLYTKSFNFWGTTSSRSFSWALSLDPTRKLLFSRPRCFTPFNLKS